MLSQSASHVATATTAVHVVTVTAVTTAVVVIAAHAVTTAEVTVAHAARTVLAVRLLQQRKHLARSQRCSRKTTQ